MASRLLLVATLVVAVVNGYPRPYPQGAIAIPRPGPDGSYGKDHYFQYTNVPAEKVFEWGYRRGNDPAHFREEYLSQKDHTFKAKLKWGDGYEGQGESFWDYNHGPRYDEPAYAPPSYAPPPPPAYVPARR